MREAIAEKPSIEYLDGQAYPKVSPRLAHGVVQGNLTIVLTHCAGERGIVAPELHVYPGRVDQTKTVFVPDPSFVSWERIDSSVEHEEPRSPDVAAEVRSPSNDLRYLEKKIARYLATGSILVIDVDPERRVIHVHDAHGTQRFETGKRFGRACLPWLNFDVAEVFANLDRLSRAYPAD